MARRTKKTDGRVTALLEALRRGNTRRCACALVGISTETFYRWLNDPEAVAFRDAVERAEADAEERFLEKISTAACDSWQAAAWWLERRHHLDWRRRETHELDLHTRSDDELAAILAQALESAQPGSETGGGDPGTATGGTGPEDLGA